MFIGEQSPIKVDHNMQTTVEGLYAIGDCSYCGSGLAGAVPAPPGRNRGSGILNAVFAADRRRQRHICAPLHRADGGAEEVIDLVQKAMGPGGAVRLYAGRPHGKGRWPSSTRPRPCFLILSPEDMHEAMNCHEAEAMVLSAKLHYTASKMRKESRGWFLREDYPKMDNENWLKWIIVKNADGEMTLTTEAGPWTSGRLELYTAR